MLERNRHPIDKNGDYDQRRHINDVWSDLGRQSDNIEKVQTRVEKVDSIWKTIQQIDNRLIIVYKVALTLLGVNVVMAAYILSIIFGR